MLRWLARVAASAAVRRLVYLAIAAIMALVLSFVPTGKAHAQNTYSCLSSTQTQCTREQAYNECMARGQEDWDAAPNQTMAIRCEVFSTHYVSQRQNAFTQAWLNVSSPNNFHWMTPECGVGGVWNEELKQCLNGICANAGVWHGQGGVLNPGAKGLLRCLITTPDGWEPGDPSAYCMYTAMTLQPGQPNAGYVGWVPSGQECDGDNVQCPAGYSRGVGAFDQDTCYPVKTCEVGEVDPATGECPNPDVCPEGMEKTPAGDCRVASDNCPFGTAKAPDGSCVEDPGQCKTGTVKGDDGTCKTDSDGDGEPDEDGEGHTATDSASCGSPPICNGDEIMCLHAKQLWRIDCNTRRNANVTLDNYCNTPPVCDRVALGDDNRALGCTRQEEASLFLQWRQVCEAEKANDALERIAESVGGGAGGKCGPGTTDTDCDGQPDWTQNAGDGLAQAGLTDPGEDTVPGDVIEEGPQFGADGLNVIGFGYGSTCPTIPDVQINGQTISFDISVFCDWLKLGGQFVLIIAALVSLRIMTHVGGG